MKARSVLTIGNFDGVHVGHCAILDQAALEGADRSLPVVAVTFVPHPLSILKPGREPLALMTRDQKIEALIAAGANTVEVFEPTPALLSQGPEPFLEQIVSEYAPAVIVEGADFRFGKDRQGDTETLAVLGSRFGFESTTVDQVQVSLQDQFVVPVSSSLIRWLLAAGRVVDVASCLGRSFKVTGYVVSGEKRGRQLGFPTINLELADSSSLMTPAPGVYAGLAGFENGGEHIAAISVGSQATFGGRSSLIEAHLLDFSGDLYGQSVTLSFDRWLRDQALFPSAGLLQDQLGRDVAHVRRWATREFKGGSAGKSFPVVVG